MRGYLLLDGDNRGLPDREVISEGLNVGRWRRYEAESYLVHPDAIERFLTNRVKLFASKARQFLENELPPAVIKDPLANHDYLNLTPASKTLLPGAFAAVGDKITKDEYYLIAEQMKPEEIPPEVSEKLDEIAAAIGL